LFKATTKRKTNISVNDIKKALKVRKVKVGFPKSKGSVIHEESEMNVASIGAVHEFGSPARNIPERSFIRTTINEQQENIKKLFQKESKKVVAGEQTVEGMLGVIGLYVSGQIKKKIVAIKTPPNKAATIKAKGSSNPLVDTSQMLQSVDFEVTK